jgi:hypothetical protein
MTFGTRQISGNKRNLRRERFRCGGIQLGTIARKQCSGMLNAPTVNGLFVRQS